MDSVTESTAPSERKQKATPKLSSSVMISRWNTIVHVILTCKHPPDVKT